MGRQGAKEMGDEGTRDGAGGMAKEMRQGYTLLHRGRGRGQGTWAWSQGVRNGAGSAREIGRRNAARPAPESPGHVLPEVTLSRKKAWRKKLYNLQ